MYSVILEPWVTLDPRFLGQDIVVFALEVFDNLREAGQLHQKGIGQAHERTYLDSLSIWSPKPGVSTMVNEIRVPSSSNSRSACKCEQLV